LDEHPFSTARREAFEEIGLPTSDDKLPPGFTVEHLCELPVNLAKTELGVRPCVAFLHPSTDSSSEKDTTSSIDVERTLIPRLDPKEVAAVFTAPFPQFLLKEWKHHSPGPTAPSGPHSWYRGSWTDWHASRWRMHNFYVPRGDPSTGSVRENEAKSRTSGTSHNNNNDNNKTQNEGEKGKQPEGDDPRPEPLNFEQLSYFRVFGMTARILVDAARVAYAREPEFEHNSHFGDEGVIGGLLGMGRLGERRGEGELTGEVMRVARSRM
jgi:hypothetical protein